MNAAFRILFSAIFAFAAATGLAVFVLRTIGQNPVIGFAYFVAVMAAAWWGGYASGILATFLTFSTAPYLFSVVVPAPLFVTRLLLVLVVSILVSSVAARRKRIEADLRKSNATLDDRMRLQSVELEETAQALSDTEVAFHTMADAAPVLMWTAGPDKLCDYFNMPWLEFTGRRIEQELGEGWADGVHDADRDRCLEVYTSGFDVRRPFVMEYRLRRHDGEYRWVLDSAVPRWSGNGKFLGFIGSCIDIHERKATEARLRESEERYRVMTETASDGIITIDEQSTVLFANRAAGRIFGYEVAEIVGQSLTRLMPEHLQQAHRSSLSRYVATGEKHLSWDRVELPGLHKNGREIALELSFGEHTDGSMRIFTGVVRDVTERNRLEEQLRHTAKLESLGVLAGGVAHDFNNLLTGVLGHTSLVLDSLPPHDPNRASLREVLLASEHAANLTRQLLAYAGKGRFVVEAIDASALIREISALVQASIPKRVHLRLDLRKDLLPITADRGQIQQVIMNLVINAAEAIPDDQTGTVLVTTSMHEVDETYMRLNFTGEELTPGTYVCMEVHDSGIGMDEATIAKIFDPFFTTKVMGRGLGLSAVLGIVRGHKGALRIYSTVGKGSTFKVLFPVASQTSVQPLYELPASLQGSGKVLVVDDEAFVRRTAQAALERYGYTVLLAENGFEALSTVRGHMDIRLILLDLSMPHMDGIETLRRVMALNSNLRIVLSSGYNEIEATQRFTGKGLAGFIQKPYTAAALAGVVQRVLQSKPSITLSSKAQEPPPPPPTAAQA